MRSLHLPILLTVLCFFAASGSGAVAHHGGDHPAWEVDEFENEALMADLEHPLHGMDHLVAMLAVGALAGLLRRGLQLALIGAIGLGALHGGGAVVETKDLYYGLGIFLGTAGVVLLGAAAARALKSLPPLGARLAGASVVLLGALLAAVLMIPRR